MRRGLISWSREEVPESLLDERVNRLRRAMAEQGWGAVLAYTSFCQPSAVHWLCNFVPYWSEAMLVVLPDRAPVLLAALTKRVHPWIRTVSHVEAVIAAPRLGAGVAAHLAAHLQPGVKVGVVELDYVPCSVMQPLADAMGGERLADASEVFGGLRQPADAPERRLARQALRIAREALKAVPATAAATASVLEPIERSARLAGAEEVLLRIAPDLAKNAALERMEGSAALGARYAVEVSVAYKGVWVRLAESLARGTEPAEWQAARQWFDAAASAAPPSWPAPGPGRLAGWTLEACVGMDPLAVVAAQDAAAGALPAGSLAVFSACLEVPGGAWLRGAPLVTGPSGGLLEAG